MKQLKLIGLVLLMTHFVHAQNVGVNTINPTENLHIRTDSSKIAIRYDNTKSSETGVNYFTAIGTPISVANVVFDTSYVDWTDLNASKLISSDNILLNSPMLDIWPEATANPVRIYFDFAPTIPSTAIITNVTLNAEWKRNGNAAGELRITITELRQAINNQLLIGFGMFKRITSSTDEVVSYPYHEIFNPVTPDMLNLNDVYISLFNLHSVSLGLSRLEIDKMWLEVEYNVPANGSENVSWTTGAKDGLFKIANAVDLSSNEYLSIDETGVTQLKGLKINKNAGAGKILTSNEDGRAFWANLPVQSEVLWLDNADTARYASGPVQIYNKIGSPALIFDKGENRLNNGINFAETDNRFFNILIDADNDQMNEQFNIYRDSSQFLGQDPAFRFSLNGASSWLNGGGNVGIGTQTPSEKLVVMGSVKSTGFIMPTGAASGNVLTSDATGNASWQPAPSTADSDWTDSGTFVSNTTADIGIGTTSPLAHLEVVTDDAKGNAVSFKVDKDITNLTGTQRGIEIDLDRANAGSTYGMEIDLNSTSSGTGIVNGLDVTVNTLNTSSQTEGVDIHVERTDGSGTTPTIGLRVQADNNTTAGNVYGIRSEVCGTTGTLYGVYSSQKAICNSTGTHYAGYFDGDVFTTASYLPSDANLKLNYLPAANDILDRLRVLDVKSYEYDHARFNEMSLPQGRQTGFTAQNLQHVFPELVKKQIHPGEMPEEGFDGESGIANVTEFLGVNYTGLIPYLVKAIQEQQVQIEAMQKEIDRLK